MRHATPMTIGFHMLVRPDGRLPAAVHPMPEQNDMEAHDHLFHEIMLVQAGTGVHVTADGRRTLRPGDLFVIRPQVWHAFEQTRKLALTNLLVRPELLRRFQDDLAAVPAAFELFHRRWSQPWKRPPVALHANPAQRRELDQLLQSLLREQTEQRAGWRVALAAYAMQVLVATTRLAAGQMAATDSTDAAANDRLVQEAVAYLEAGFVRDVSLEELAEHCAVSGCHLSRHFNRRMGMGINAYIHRLRAEEACRLLRATEMRVTDIAAQVGYDDVAYFGRCFRHQVGMSPRTYRKSGRLN